MRGGGSGRVSLPQCVTQAGAWWGPLEAHKEGSVDAVLDVNLTGTVRMLQAFLPTRRPPLGDAYIGDREHRRLDG